VLRMAEDGDRSGAAEQEAAIKAVMEAARKAKTAGASRGQKRLGTVRIGSEAGGQHGAAEQHLVGRHVVVR
jgi:hypothetical protein